jgi:hypothetical protein
MRLIEAVLVSLAVAGAAFSAAAEPATMSSFGIWRFSADGYVQADDRRFSIYVHPKENLLMIQPKIADTVRMNPSQWPVQVWRDAAEAFVEPLGCDISDVEVMMRSGATWQAAYVCPSDVDLRKLVREQKADLKQGVPLHK